MYLGENKNKITANKIKYSNKEITIVWQPKICRHSAIYIKTPPNEYKPNEKPWINIEKASTEEMKKQIHKYTSGVLSFYKNNE